MEDRNIQLEFVQLLSLFSDGRLNDAELVRLGLLMQSDVELRKQYLEYCQMHALLRRSMDCSCLGHLDILHQTPSRYAAFTIGSTLWGRGDLRPLLRSFS